MNLEIIAVGTEILHGDIANTNAQYISKKMELIGVNVLYHSVVGDNRDRIKRVFATALDRADIIIATGGLGPTQDDITKEALAELLNLDMIYNEESHMRIKERFENRGIVMPENNLRQAYFPQGANIIVNKNGTADACKLCAREKKIYLLPGVPFEAYALIDEYVVPDVEKNNNFVLYHQMVKVFNMGESQSEILLMDIIKKQTNPTIASYADKEKLVYRITAKAESKEIAKNMVEKMVAEVLDVLKENATVLEEE